jgi:hypothetical protein
MAIRKYRSDLPNWFQDDFGWIKDWLHPFRSSWTVRGEFVDTDKYEIRPRPEYRQTLIENKQKEIDRLEEERKRLENELKELKTG